MLSLVKIIIFLLLFSSFADAITLQKANIYRDQDVTGWMISEKLDGIRAYWDGKNLLSRQNKIINAPKYFTKDLPPFELDGELWTQRGDFENIQSIVMTQTPSKKWSEISYMIFEVPHASGNFKERLGKIQKYLEVKSLPHIKIIEQKTINSREEQEQFLENIIKNGGEGAMLKDGSKKYFDGRRDYLLKVKKAQDMEAKVIGYKSGKGKFIDMMGSLQVELENGVKFYIGSGFSDEQRKNPPKIGEMVTFKYYGFTKEGKPKFASFMRVRVD
jgi:DNA ligase-1